MKRMGLSGGAAIAAILVFTALAGAASVTWTGAAGDNKWSNTGNWSGGALPTVATPIVFDNAAPTSPTGVLIDVTGAGKGVTITANHDVTFLKGGTTSTWNQESNNVITVDPVDGLAHTYTIGDGTAANNPGFPQANTGDGFSDAVWTINGTSKLVVNIAMPTNGNSWTKDGTGTLQIGTGGLYNAPFSMQNVFNIKAGVVDDQAQYNSYFTAKSTGSTINIYSGATLLCESNSVLTNTITFAGNGKIVMNTKLDGSGTVKTMASKGAIWTPGTDGTAGMLTLLGNTTFSQNGTTNGILKIDITGSGTTAGVDFDQLNTNGTVTGIALACDLVVNASGAVAGNTYKFLTSSNTLVGQNFHAVTVNNTALPYTLTGTTTGYQITFTPEPCTLGLLGIGCLIALRRRA